MTDFIQLEVETELVSEFIEEIEIAFQNAEIHIITLEKGFFDLHKLEFIKELFNELCASSVRLHLIPLTEILDHAIMVYDKFIEWHYFSAQAAELILLHMDRIIHLAKDIEQSKKVKASEVQNIVVSFQHISEIRNSEECDEAIAASLKSITSNITENTIQTDVDDLLEMFNQNPATLSLDTKEPASPDKESNKAEKHNQSIDEQSKDINIHVPETDVDPLMFAKEIISTLNEDKSLMLLSDISEHNNTSAYYHSQFLLEIALSINYLAGEPINSIGLAQGICLYDIAMVPLRKITSKPCKLSDKEYKLIQQHPLKAAKLAERMNIHEDGINAIIHHHERIDGQGYPDNLKKNQISNAGKLISIIDSFNAMIEKRPHKKFTRSILRSIAELNACVDTHYDKHWIKHFNLFMKQHWLPIQKIQCVQNSSVQLG